MRPLFFGEQGVDSPSMGLLWLWSGNLGSGLNKAAKRSHRGNIIRAMEVGDIFTGSKARVLIVAAGLSFAVLIAVISGVLVGCGAKEARQAEKEEVLVLQVIENIIVPKSGSGDFLVEWRRLSSGPGDVEPEELGIKFWKYQGGSLQEIGREEHAALTERPGKKGSGTWAYSQHSITLLELDWERGEAVVEVGSLYNVLSGEGVRYLLRREDGRWVKVSEETVWAS